MNLRLLASIALKHILARRRQSMVSLFGIVLGVALFLAISSLMRGSERDFIRRLVDNTPHVTVVDEFRRGRRQPVEEIFASGAVEIRRVKPLTEPRGIRHFGQILAYVKSLPGAEASPMLEGQGLINFAGKDAGIKLNGMIPADLRKVSTIGEYMVEGTIDDLIANPEGIVIGHELAAKMSLAQGDNISVTGSAGASRTFKILGIFKTGRATYDERETFIELKRAQALLNRPNRANSIIVKLPDPYLARAVATGIESRHGYKAISWQESSADIMSTLAIRNAIMYTVVSAVLVVAAFGIYNVISTVVLEKNRDIAILKSMGFKARDIRLIFLIQGLALGLAGCAIGLPMGSALMSLLMSIKLKPPGATDAVPMPIDWSPGQFAIAAGVALFAAVAAAYFPARRGSRVQPVDILRGGAG